MSRRIGLASALFGSASLLALGVAQAQDTGDLSLGTILLYGDRTNVLADDSNASVAVITEEQIDTPVLQEWTDTFRRMSNVLPGDWTESGFVLRGVNSEGQTPGGLGAPVAGFYVDGVQQTVEGTRRGLRGTFDVEQVEVYRGPQSTLSGRAALAGAIYLRTKDPEFERSGRVQLTYGSDNLRQVGLAFGDHVGDKFAYRISGEWSDKDNDLNYPSYERFDRYDDYVGDNYHTLRGKFLFRPAGTDTTRILLSFAHSFDSPKQNDIAGPLWSSTAPGYDTLRGDVWGTILPDFYAGFGLTELPVFQDVRETTVDNLGLEITHEISPELSFTALTGVSHSVTDRNSINEGTAGEFLVTQGEFDQRLASQEFRLNYDNGDLRWVAGLYLAKEDQRSFRNQTLLSFDQSRNTTDISNQALFGEASWQVASGLRVIAGGRIDHIKQDQTSFYSVNGATTADTASTFEDTVFIPKLGLEYAFGNGQTVALTYQEGYRPGGSGIIAFDGSEFDYDPESTRTLELSWRGRLAQDRLGIKANLFVQDWKNQQVEIWSDPFDPSTSYVANAGRSESWGAEVELDYAASDRLQLWGSFGVLHTEFTDFETATGDYSGLPFPAAPEATLAVGFDWTGDDGFFANGSVKYVGTSMSRLEQGVDRPLDLDPYTTVDVAAGYAWDDLRLTACATNLFDEEYFTYEYGPGAYATLGERREIGLRMDYSF